LLINNACGHTHAHTKRFLSTQLTLYLDGRLTVFPGSNFRRVEVEGVRVDFIKRSNNTGVPHYTTIVTRVSIAYPRWTATPLKISWSAIVLFCGFWIDDKTTLRVHNVYNNDIVTEWGSLGVQRQSTATCYSNGQNVLKNLSAEHRHLNLLKDETKH